MIRFVFILFACLSLCACTPFSGGAVYKYQFTTPEGKKLDLKVESNREVDEGVEVNIDPETGKLKVKTGTLSGGPDNMQVLINALVAAFLNAINIGVTK